MSYNDERYITLSHNSVVFSQNIMMFEFYLILILVFRAESNSLHDFGGLSFSLEAKNFGQNSKFKCNDN